jgi:Fe-S oxidoreductase
MTDLEQHRDALLTCSFCPKLCRFACPVTEAEARESVAPWGLMTLADDLRRGLTDLNPAVGELWTHCTGCGACTASCLHETPVGPTIMSLRSIARTAGALPNGLDQWGRMSPQVSERYLALPFEGDTLILAGHLPTSQLDAALHVVAALEIQRPYRLRVGASAGGRLAQAGLVDEFASHVATLTPELVDARRVLCLDPSDYQAFREYWPNGIEEQTSIETLIQSVYEARDRLAPVIEGDGVVMESCQLSRSKELSQATYEIMERLIQGQLIEPVVCGQNSGCCGAGAGYAHLHPDSAAEVAQEALFDTGSDPVIAFGQCVGHLQSSAPERAVRSWVELVMQSLIPEGV